jgi:hypothetical protein
MELVGPNEKPFAQPTVAHDPDDLQVRTAIARPLAAGITSPTVHVGLDAASVPRPDVLHVGSDGQDFDPELMARDPREGKERELAQIATDIRSADPHPMGPNQRLTRSRSPGPIDGDLAKLLRFNDLNCAHGSRSNTVKKEHGYKEYGFTGFEGVTPRP